MTTVMGDRINIVLVVHVYSQFPRGRGFIITEVAGVGLESQLYHFHMPIQISYKECFLVTEFEGKAGLDLKMYHFTNSN